MQGSVGIYVSRLRIQFSDLKNSVGAEFHEVFRALGLFGIYGSGAEVGRLGVYGLRGQASVLSQQNPARSAVTCVMKVLA